MKSITKIKKQSRKKTRLELAGTIILTSKNEFWREVAGILSGPRRNRIALNLNYIDENTKTGESIIVPGKVLSQGEVGKKFKISAMDFSKRAKDKLLKADCKVLSIEELIKKNPDGKGMKILK